MKQAKEASGQQAARLSSRPRAKTSTSSFRYLGFFAFLVAYSALTTRKKRTKRNTDRQRESRLRAPRQAADDDDDR